MRSWAFYYLARLVFCWWEIGNSLENQLVRKSHVWSLYSWMLGDKFRGFTQFLPTSLEVVLLFLVQFLWSLLFYNVCKMLFSLIASLAISKPIRSFCMLVLFAKLRFYRISGHVFSLISWFLSKIQFCMVLDGKSWLDRVINFWVPYYPIRGPTISLQMMLFVILLSMLMIVLSALNMNWFWSGSQLGKLEPYFQDIVDWSRKWFVNSDTGKIQLIAFDL